MSDETDGRCVTRWGRQLPAFVCSLAGRDDGGWSVLLGAGLGAALLLLAAATAIAWRGSRAAGGFRNWLDSLR